jgi:uncharacterized protein (DUF1501 family)
MTTSCLVVLFLRGGADGLSLVAPTEDPHYQAARPGRLRVKHPGKRSRLLLDDPLADLGFSFHPEAAPLAELYAERQLAVVHACGLKDATRSHFDAEERMERAAAGQGAHAGGWLARWLNRLQPAGILPALAIGASAPESLRGFANVAVAPSLSDLRLAPGHGYAQPLRRVLGNSFTADTLLADPLQHLLQLTEEIEARVGLDEAGNLKAYVPDQPYPADNSLAAELQSVAHAIKLDLGLRVACVDYGGWDTHINQSQDLPPLIAQLSAALAAFWSDLGERRNGVHVLVISEFGRRLRANNSAGTDHGHGNLALLLGPKLRGGRMYGIWPGLESKNLDRGADLAITTDYRSVLWEVLAQQDLEDGDFEDLAAHVFPGFAPASLDLFG